MSTFRVALAEAIRRERERLGLSQAELAPRLGWSISRTARVEAGQTDVKATELPRVCSELSVTLAELLQLADQADLSALNLPQGVGLVTQGLVRRSPPGDYFDTARVVINEALPG